MKKKLSFFFFLITTTWLQAQVVLENNPTSLSWYQINTKDFRVLYPKGYEEQAQRMANTLQHLHDAEGKSMGSSPRKISVLLQNQSSVSNGFVTMIPRHSEFYTMPPQNYNFVGTNDWLNLLASHEYRHVAQYQHAMRGFNRVVFYLFGYPTYTGMAQVSAPQWFWEGDAVATETAFTPGGRGRIPNFGLIFRTNFLEGRTFNYSKQYLRSYKNNIPNHYVLGYYMISYLRKKTNDENIWGDITRRSWNVPFIPFRFSSSIHAETGMHVNRLFKSMAADLKKEWQQTLDGLNLTSFEKLNPRKGKTYTDYQYPQPQEDGSVLAMKSSLGTIEEFVLLKDGKEQKIFTPGILNDAGMLSAHSHVVVWNEYGFDPRWRVKTFSQVKLLDMEKKTVRVIGGRRDRLAGAALSPKGDKIATIRSDNNYKNSLMVYEFFTGKLLTEFSTPNNDFIAMPRWTEDNDHVLVVRTTKLGKTISSIDVTENTITDLLPVDNENLGHPVPAGNYVMFNSPVSGIDNIYAVDLTTKQRYQITCSKYGAYNPALSKDGKTLYYNDQTRDGMDVVQVPFEPSQWRTFDAKPFDDPLAATLTAQEGHHRIFDSIPATTYTPQHYSKLKGIINPYAWGFNISNDLAQLNFGIASRDLLSTTSVNAGYSYDLNERQGLWKAGVSYQGLYPIIDVTAVTGNRSKSENIFGKADLKWKETTVEGGLRVPLLLTRSKYMQELTIGSAVGVTSVSSFKNVIRDKKDSIVYQGGQRANVGQLSDGYLFYNHTSLVYSHVMKLSYRDFLYRWGQTFAADAYTTPFLSNFYGTLWSVRSTLYFPGLAKQHYLYFRGAYQVSDQGSHIDSYTFRNTIAKPRGFSYPANQTFASLSANYALPLWYPDIALGPILNIQRLRANVFYDYGQGTGQTYYFNPIDHKIYYELNNATYQSVGAETMVTFNLLRFLPRFEVGARATYRLQNKYYNSGTVFEILIGNIGF